MDLLLSVGGINDDWKILFLPFSKTLARRHHRHLGRHQSPPPRLHNRWHHRRLPQSPAVSSDAPGFDHFFLSPHHLPDLGGFGPKWIHPPRGAKAGPSLSTFIHLHHLIILTQQGFTISRPGFCVPGILAMMQVGDFLQLRRHPRFSVVSPTLTNWSWQGEDRWRARGFDASTRMRSFHPPALVLRHFCGTSQHLCKASLSESLQLIPLLQSPGLSCWLVGWLVTFSAPYNVLLSLLNEWVRCFLNAHQSNHSTRIWFCRCHRNLDLRHQRLC